MCAALYVKTRQIERVALNRIHRARSTHLFLRMSLAQNRFPLLGDMR
ncbi:hypothetical protein CEV31_0185 [Brucella thiophenivorans]|uniref:Uncharacterized protein n=1 Tax=Brucella thiophenivorans TaxID=571255 RepID=A0A256G6C2_9HYPH|nr:hypothetical protein CEV31_0185 [Brucella thiophenivorans]